MKVKISNNEYATSFRDASKQEVIELLLDVSLERDELKKQKQSLIDNSKRLANYVNQSKTKFADVLFDLTLAVDWSNWTLDQHKELMEKIK